MARVVLCLATAVSLGACSAQMDRFSSYPDVNTASLPDQETQTRSVQQSQLNSADNAQQNQQAWQNAPVNQRPAYTPNRPVQQAYAPGGQITVQPGQTLYSIAHANNLSTDQLAAANNIPPPYTIQVGQMLRIPGNRNVSAPQPRVQAVNRPVMQQKFAQNAVHVVAPGETLFAVGRTYNMNPYKIADYNGLSHNVSLRVGQRLRIPGHDAMARNQAPVRQHQPQQQAYNAPLAQQQNDTANLNRQQLSTPPKRSVVRQPVAQIDAQQTEQQTTDVAGSGFRWPVRGRVISTFGQKPNGMRNEGINISVPMGTSVRAAESGVVAYAGNELKGYGNLVLIRHENGWVTAYAHNSSLFVKRGDTVKRGDIIAKVGQTGSVTSPQLHFEVRKGASAVDPLKYLDLRQAAN